MDLKPGDQLGPYEILALIGKGGMGEVWKARDSRLNRVVAIKRLKSNHTARFELEARAIAALNHSHVCQIYDVGPDYLVMEYVEGTPLHGPAPAVEVLRVAVQIASALEAAHAKGIVHRDLKPANILMTASGVKLLDFGLAKLLNPNAEDATLTMEGTVAGTAAYMSPEQARGEALDARSDIFSFGVVMYELMAGRCAFTGMSVTDILSAVLRDEPAMPDGPTELIRVVRKCMRKARGERYASAAEVRAALEQVRVDSADQSSIAVLPFANMSSDKEQEYFSDGLAEEIINLLAQVPNLRVTARTSAFAFRGSEQDITKIAEVLRVKSVLEGSVRRSGNRIRVTAQLINAADGYHLWSERFDRELTDVFAIQDEIAAAITGALRLKLGAAPARHIPKMAAYEAYLKYLYYLWKLTPEDLRRVREHLELALALDPKFALPYAGLADQHLVLASVGGMTADDAMPQARELAQRALELDPDLPEAHALLGLVAGHYDFDWSECERHFARAMAREPVPCLVRQKCALFRELSLGHAEEARQHLELVIEQDPLCQMWHYTLGIILQSLGLRAQAVAACRKSVELDPQFWIGWWCLGTFLAIEGQHDEARECAAKAYAIAPWSPYSIGLMAGVCDSAGELLDKLQSDAYAGPLGLFCYHLVRGEIDSAVDALTRALENQFPVIIAVCVRGFEPLLRNSAGWPALLKTMNLPEGA